MPNELRYVRLPSIKLYGGVIKLRYPRVIYNSTGRKILLISDSLALEEAQAGKLFSGRIGTTVANIFEKAIELEGIEPAQVLSVTTRVVRRPSQLSDAQRGENYRRITRRIGRLIKHWQPDAVVFLGYQSFLEIWRSRVKFTEREYKNNQLAMLRGRLLSAKIAGHDCQIVLSFSPKAFASLDYKDFKNRCNLIGFVLQDMAAAIRGKNLYTVPAIDPAKRSVITSIKEFDRFFLHLLACPTPSMDTETDNLNRVYGNRLLVILFTLDGKHTYLLPFQHPQTPFVPKELEYIAERMRYYFEECRSKYIIFQNAKFDILQFFAQLKIQYFNHRIFDLMAGEYFLDENRKFFRHEQLEGAYTLEFISAQYGALGYEISPIAKTDRGRMAEFSLQQILDYGVFDVCYPYFISQFQIAEARRRGQQYHLYLRTVCELGSDMVTVFTEMERNGVPVDLNYLTSLITPNSSLSQELAKLQQKFHNLPTVQKVNARLLANNGAPKNSYGLYGNKHNDLWLFDINKAKHQQALFFEELKLQPLEYRKDGGGKTNKAFLQEYQDTITEVKLLADYRQHEKLRNTYVVGLLKQLTEYIDNATDHRLRAFYWFIYILTVRSCFTPDTPVYVLDDRAVVPIKDIKPGDWIWSYNKLLQPVPAQVSWAGRTKKARTVTVVYQGYNPRGGRGYGGITESIKTVRCSVDERFRLRDGTYRRADKLRPGDRILALERHYNKDGYRRLFWTGMPNGRRVLEHQYIIKHRKTYITHHDNEITDDNRPPNLIEMTQNEHMKHHDFHAYTKRKIRISRRMRREYRLGIRKASMAGKFREENPNYKPLDKNWAIKILMKNKWHPTIFRDKYDMDYTITMRKLKELGIDCRKMRQRYNGDDEFITDEMLEKASKLNSLNEAAAYLKVNYYKAKKLLANDHNHIIVKIIKNKKREWLWDLEVPKYHNFIANGLCVHNSATNPNLQNLPSHGILAKIIKRLFIASAYCILVKVDYIAHEVRGWANTSKDYNIANAFAPGMLLRRKVRILRGLNVELDYDLEEWLQENKWEKLDIEQQQELIKKTRNRSEMYELLKLLIELIIKGDVHRMNYQHFFGVPAAKVNKEQRQSVKEVVFGVMYEKAAPALAAAVYFKILQPIRRKFIFRMNRAQIRKNEERYKELQDDLNSELKPYWDKAQDLIDKLFNKFRRGGRWIRKLQENAAKNLYTVSPFGAVRHLWGYLHSERSMHNVMNRRGPNCVDIKTECLTEHGWKFVNELAIGERIYTKNITSGQLELQPIKAITKTKYKGRMWELNGSVNALVTPNHRWLIDYGKRQYQRPEMVTSEYIAGSKNNNSIHLVADAPHKQSGGDWTNNEIRAIGWILTDGYYIKGNKKPNSQERFNSRRVAITQSIRGNPEKVKMIDRLMNNLEIDFTRTGPDATHKIRWQFYGDFGDRIKTALPKKVITPEFLHSLSTRQLQILYDTMLLGNGSFNFNLDIYTNFGAGTKRKADAFSMLCVLLGIAHKRDYVQPRISEHQYDSMPNIPQPTRKFWIVTLKQRKRAQAMFFNSWVKYNGKVWCPTVDNGTFVARRKGSVYITGNSVIQGSASNLGYTGARQMIKLNWELLKRKLNIGYKHCNFVHDSIEAENKITMLPLSLYYLEHSMTTQTHARARQTFGFNMIIGLEIDIELGGSMARMQKWDGTEASLLRIVGEEIDWMNKELKYKMDKKELLRCVRFNYRQVNHYRIKELQAMRDDYAPTEEMLLTPERATKLTWMNGNGGKVPMDLELVA